MKPIVFHPEAKAEFDAAADRYDREADLADAFVAEVEKATRLIAQMPEAFPVHPPSGLRKCVLKRFPFNVYFLERLDQIWIAAVAHQRRRPGYWADRIPK